MSTPVAAELVFDAIQVGETFAIERTFTAEDVLAFARLSGDFSPLHVDSQYAATTEFGQCVVHGMLLASLFSQLVGMRIPGKHALYLGQDLAFRKPVLVGEKVSAIARVTGKNEPTRSLLLATEIRDAQDRAVVSGSAKVKVRDGQAPAASKAQAAAAAPEGTRRPVAIVTGASRGIGAAIARALARRGVAVGVNFHRRKDLADGVVDEIQSAGGKALAVQADVCNSGDVEAMISTVAERLGPATMLVNNAVGDLEETPAAALEWPAVERQLAYQVKAVLEICQRVYPAMKAAGGGTIVNLASQVVEGTPPPLMAGYVCAKYGLVGLSKALAVEWAAERIRVNIVSPGLTRTELTQHYNEKIFKLEAARVPLRRLCEPADVAEAVAFLLSDEAKFITGINVPVTGGMSMP